MNIVVLPHRDKSANKASKSARYEEESIPSDKSKKVDSAAESYVRTLL
jgi:hypothetical protein